MKNHRLLPKSYLFKNLVFFLILVLISVQFSFSKSVNEKKITLQVIRGILFELKKENESLLEINIYLKEIQKEIEILKNKCEILKGKNNGKRHKFCHRFIIPLEKLLKQARKNMQRKHFRIFLLKKVLSELNNPFEI